MVTVIVIVNVNLYSLTSGVETDGSFGLMNRGLELLTAPSADT